MKTILQRQARWSEQQKKDEAIRQRSYLKRKERDRIAQENQAKPASVIWKPSPIVKHDHKSKNLVKSTNDMVKDTAVALASIFAAGVKRKPKRKP